MSVTDVVRRYSTPDPKLPRCPLSNHILGGLAAMGLPIETIEEGKSKSFSFSDSRNKTENEKKEKEEDSASDSNITNFLDFVTRS